MVSLRPVGVAGSDGAVEQNEYRGDQCVEMPSSAMALTGGVLASTACDGGGRPEAVTPDPAATATPWPSPPPMPSAEPPSTVTLEPTATPTPLAVL